MIYCLIILFAAAAAGEAAMISFLSGKIFDIIIVCLLGLLLALMIVIFIYRRSPRAKDRRLRRHAIRFRVKRIEKRLRKNGKDGG